MHTYTHIHTYMYILYTYGSANWDLNWCVYLTFPFKYPTRSQYAEWIVRTFSATLCQNPTPVSSPAFLSLDEESNVGATRRASATSRRVGLKAVLEFSLSRSKLSRRVAPKRTQLLPTLQPSLLPLSTTFAATSSSNRVSSSFFTGGSFLFSPSVFALPWERLTSACILVRWNVLTSAQTRTDMRARVDRMCLRV